MAPTGGRASRWVVRRARGARKGHGAEEQLWSLALPHVGAAAWQSSWDGLAPVAAVLHVFGQLPRGLSTGRAAPCHGHRMCVDAPLLRGGGERGQSRDDEHMMASSYVGAATPYNMCMGHVPSSTVYGRDLARAPGSIVNFVNFVPRTDYGPVEYARSSELYSRHE